jgi:hypothetical protein
MYWRISVALPRKREKCNVKIFLIEIYCEDGRWVELAQDHVHWQPVVIAVLKLRFLLPQC